LGLDLGSSGIKALLLDRGGGERGCAVGVTPFAGGEMTVAQFVAAVAGVVGQLGSGRDQVAAVGIAGMAESGAPLAPDGRQLAPIIAWHDARGGEVVERLLRLFGPDLERAIGQRLRVVSSVAKLGWLVDHGVGPITRWLGVPELVLEALTARQMTDFSLAARSGAYHLRQRRYLSDVVAALRLPGGVFPPVAAAGTPMGRIDARGARWSGLPRGIPVTVAGHDHLAAWAGSGATDADVVNSVGTAETVVAVTGGFPDVDAALARRVAVTLPPRGDGWAVLASATRSGIVLAAIADALGSSPPDLDRAAAAGWLGGGAGAESGGGEGLGGGAGSGRGAGLAAQAERLITAALAASPLEVTAATPGELWNAVLTTLATRTWDACDRLAGVVPVAVALSPAEPPSRLVVCGGGSRSWPWLQAKAAARPGAVVCRSAAPEAVARGAALYAGIAARWWPELTAAPRPDVVPIANALPPPWPADRC
jgi:xylulokinase